MSMVVRSNIMALNANRQLGVNSNTVSKSLEKLSSGFKINRAGDDASGLAISEKMQAKIKNLEQASLNSQDAISLVQTAEGALTEVHSMLNRMSELAMKSANGTMDGDGVAGGIVVGDVADGDTLIDRSSLQNEVNKLATEIDRIAKTTDFNGLKLLDGTFTQNFQIGATSDTNDQVALTISNMDATSLGAGDGTNGVDISTPANAVTAIDTVKTAINRVSVQRGELGALQNRLEHTVNNLDVTTENLSAANSRIKDTDMAKEMMNYTKMNVLSQAAQAMLAQANQQPQSVLQLLQ